MRRYTDSGRAGRLLSNRIARVALSVLAGAMTGLCVYAISRTGGTLLFAVTGAVSGALVAVGLDAYRRSARLTEVKVTVPQISELTFVVNNDARQVAWQLFIESITRVSVQRLEDEDGLLRETLTSLYGLFATTRETLKSSRPSTHVGAGLTVESLAVNFLNLELRPFLSRWHPRLRDFEDRFPELVEADWQLATECRGELRELQQRARQYVLAFARLAGVRDAEEMLVARPAHSSRPVVPPRRNAGT